MGKRFDLIVFDWDGTLMDSTAAIVRALQAACRDVGVAEPSARDASHVIGLSLNDAIAHIVPGADADTIGRINERYRFHFLASDHELTMFDGTHQLIARLHREGFQLAVATGKARRGLDRVLDISGLREFFHMTRCADESFSKPHPGMLIDLMDTLMVAPERSLMIGDTTHDLQMAQNAGIEALGVSYGAHPLDVLASEPALGIVHSMTELDDWLACNA